ncbi:hypothetical protein [uncultured Ruegeria sp.]|uniref:hypothetical protein n=1 Tax=uncultured Ruegeria sp. TaxID=259304 RepID=UPI00261B6251|nr:hypothetical protein [uncultured Ruegeria sp.]
MHKPLRIRAGAAPFGADAVAQNRCAVGLVSGYDGCPPPDGIGLEAFSLVEPVQQGRDLGEPFEPDVDVQRPCLNEMDMSGKKDALDRDTSGQETLGARADLLLEPCQNVMELFGRSRQVAVVADPNPGQVIWEIVVAAVPKVWMVARIILSRQRGLGR